jgi:nitrate/TMAO reductase-like tetraheme cytochrome c subunit
MRPLILVLALLCAAAPDAAAQAPSPPTTEDCLACHDDASAARADGTPVAVPGATFGGSVHGGLACVDCHQDLASQAEWPHPETLANVNCATCHEEPVAQYALSAHARARRDNPASRAATCVDCHGTHDIKPSSDIASRTHHLNLPATCGRCHGNTEIIRQEKIRIGNVVAEFQDSIHGRALERSGLTVAPNCSDCHGSHDIRTRDVKESRVHRANVPDTCGTCHEGIEHQYRAGIHGTKLAQGSVEAATCADCHSAHSIVRTDNPGFQLGVVQECGTCHSDKIQTYRDTFHGQVTALGFERVAKCADCHGAHDIRPRSDPASMIAPANLVKTCSTCHPGANANFVQYDPHADKHDRERNPALYYSAKFMTFLLGGVFVFFGIHTGLWFLRSVRERRGQS